MDTEAWYQNKLASIKDDFDFKFDSLVLDITETIRTKLKEKGIKQTKLAERLNVSSAAISKLLRGESNFTIKKLVEIAEAIELKLEINLVPDAKPIEVPKKHSPYDSFIDVCIGSVDLEKTDDAFIPSFDYHGRMDTKKPNFTAVSSTTLFTYGEMTDAA